MANYATLTAAIQAAIKQNGNKEITGALLQQSLLSMINSLGAGYQYMGVAVLTPTATNPGTPDQNVFYFASEPGTYANFSGIVVGDNEVAILKWNGSWVKQTTGAGSAEQVSRLVQLVFGGTITQTQNPGTPNEYWLNNNGVIGFASSGAGMSRVNKISVVGGESINLVATGASYGTTPAAFFCDDDGNIVATVARAGTTTTFSGAVPDGATYIYINYLTTYSVSLGGIFSALGILSGSIEEMKTDIFNLNDLVFGNDYSQQAKTTGSRWIDNNGVIGIDTSGTYSRYAPISILPGQIFTYSAGPSQLGDTLFITDENDNILFKTNVIGTFTAPENAAKICINSLPASYSFRTESILAKFDAKADKQNVNSQIAEIYKYIPVGSTGTSQTLQLTQGMFETGNISGRTGQDEGANNVIRTIEPIRAIGGATLTYHTINGYRFAVSCYQIDGTFVTKREWYSGDGTIVLPSNAALLRLLIASPSGQSTTPTLADSGLTVSVNPGAMYVPAASDRKITTLPIYAPSPQIPANASADSDFNAETLTPDELFGAFSNMISSLPKPGNAFDKPKFAVVCSKVGRDASNTFDIYAYQFCKRDRFAWKAADGLFAWKNGTTIVYTDSISPRIGDTIYSTATRTNSGYTVTAFNAASQQITSSGSVVYSRSKQDNVPNDVYWSKTAQQTTPTNLDLYNRSDEFVVRGTAVDITHLTASGKTYTRCEELDYNSKQKMTIVLWGNEHGPQSDPAEPAIILYRLAKDLITGCRNNEFLSFLKNYCNVVMIPCANPYGLQNHTRNNSNNVNINRNYCTPGWAQQSDSDKGSYAGDQSETQFIMNTVAYFNADLAIDIHCLGYVSENNVGKVHYEGFIPSEEANEMVRECMFSFSVEYSNYGNAAPNASAQGSDWIYYYGIAGGLIEMNAGPFAASGGNGKQHTGYYMELDYTLLLNTLRMWMYGVDLGLDLSNLAIK